MTQTHQQPTNTAVKGVPEVDAVVVGAGMSGLYTLHKLRGLGLTVQVFEKGDGVGGTWFWNRYPGARVDVKSMDYSFSFDSELEQEWEWTEKYPPQDELLRYVNHVADRFDLRRDIKLETTVTEAVFDEDVERWHVRTDRGDQLSTQYVVMATGCLSASKVPEVPGLDLFRGRWFHTGHWPAEGVDFSGQRVAVIGTGSSGVQAIPLIAEQAAELTVFQRTPNFVLPARNHPIDPEHQRSVKARYDEVRRAARESGFGIAVPTPTKSALEVSPEERQARYESVWYDEDNNLVDMLVSYNDMITSQPANDTAAQFVRDRIAEIVEDPETAAALQPHDHPFGTKRPCLGTNYYETYNLPHVRLVNVRKTPIVEITHRGLRTTQEEFEFDDLVFATGFDAMTGALTAVDIRGRGDVRLEDKWHAGPRTYLGIQVAGFPNLFTITGPGSPSVLSNMVTSIEQHVEWVADAIAAMRAEGLSTMEPTVEAEDEWTAHVDEVGHMTLYPTADSWYMGSNVPGKPRVFMPYIGGVGVYRQKCDEVAANGYEGFVRRPQRVAAGMS
ncbi:cyclohexanone monooxygenase [Geodermatophilus bullaregiensis]|uniref:flavin-containing monooxygenase n=1 Tax=Geodermatophilus bullaregiensis TaxID=1564160 RepID=UPI00195C387E|nr:NAD(P)/FAD-dependent oxidoreductase [Geodermatophilus bullaregiensis]MBM7808719.1 cyclohexanone monooxygenase [Geodermatophilus bullaregiensis]